ncbi:hypothetical protein [Streptomyces murinus]|uniref:PIN domain-containing protein n=1 Tax=Streptomyces murinus TaxID=33900 RepID=A0A7W3NT74_STRMR|nr:hypothetical protein [Streptomyces murinus]MBA9056304.1 hypothetical protein [Streptomyces murinus]UWW90792.1 hypothetical protein GO605_07890 [Streptomyces murinus]
MDEQGHFTYGDIPGIRLGRSGRGPMRIAWDTNVLLDYLEYGFHMWDGREWPVKEGKYLEDLEALNALLNAYIFLDLRFFLFDRVLVDAKKSLTVERRQQRELAIDCFAEALFFADYGIPEHNSDPDLMQPGTVDMSYRHHRHSEQLSLLPGGHDRMLVMEALDRDIHVFMTRDQGILKNAERFKPLRLLLVSPSGLCDLIDEAQIPVPAMPAPDLARVSRVIQALGEYVGDE